MARQEGRLAGWQTLEPTRSANGVSVQVQVVERLAWMGRRSDKWLSVSVRLELIWVRRGVTGSASTPTFWDFPSFLNDVLPCVFYFSVLVAVCLHRQGRLFMCGRFTQATVLACLLSTHTTQPIMPSVLLISVFPKAPAGLHGNSCSKKHTLADRETILARPCYQVLKCRIVHVCVVQTDTFQWLL